MPDLHHAHDAVSTTSLNDEEQGVNYRAGAKTNSSPYYGTTVIGHIGLDWASVRRKRFSTAGEAIEHKE
jgi:hypothetical protein